MDPYLFELIHEHDDIDVVALVEAEGLSPDELGQLLVRYMGGTPELDRIAWLVSIPPLARPKFTPHRAQIERQLLADLEHYGVSGDEVVWHNHPQRGPVMQIRNLSLQPCAGLEVRRNGHKVAEGAWDFVALTVEIDFRAFWTDLDWQNGSARRSGIPRHVWDSLTEEQQSWVKMDSRNQQWRAGPPSWELRVD